MERNKERITNMLLQCLTLYMISSAVANCVMGVDAGYEFLIIAAVITGYALVSKLVRVIVNSFFYSILFHMMSFGLYTVFTVLIAKTALSGYTRTLSMGQMLIMTMLSLGIIAGYSVYITYARTQLDSKENLHSMVVMIPAVIGILAQWFKAELLLHASVIIAVVMVVLIIIRHYANGSANLRDEYGFDINYPGQQIKIVLNAFCVVLGLGVTAITMVLHNGAAGNYVFNLLKKGFGIIIALLRAALSGINISSERETETESTSVEFSLPDLDGAQPEPAESYIFESVENGTAPIKQVMGENMWLRIAAIVVLVAIVVCIVLAVMEIVKYIKSLRKDYVIGDDEFEAWNPEDVEFEEENIIPKKRTVTGGIRAAVNYIIKDLLGVESNADNVRKLYKQTVVKDGAKGIEGFPESITRNYITKDDKKASVITDIYEKARYSKDGVTKDELEKFGRELEIQDEEKPKE